jgi:hypothetical protein
MDLLTLSSFQNILTSCIAQGQCGTITTDQNHECVVEQYICQGSGCIEMNTPPDPPLAAVTTSPASPNPTPASDLAELCLTTLCCQPPPMSQDNTHQCWDTCASISDILALSGCHLLNPDTAPEQSVLPQPSQTSTSVLVIPSSTIGSMLFPVISEYT